MKQQRIYVNGSFQYAVTTDATQQSLATKAVEVMKLGAVNVSLSPGLINLVTK